MSNMQKEALNMPFRFIMHTVCQMQKALFSVNQHFRSQLSALIDFLFDVLSVNDVTRLRNRTNPV